MNDPRAAYEAKAGARVRRAVLHRVIRAASDVKVPITKRIWNLLQTVSFDTYQPGMTMSKDHSRLGSITFGAVGRSQKLKSFMLSTKMRRSRSVFTDTNLSISSMNEVSKKKIFWKNIFAQDPVLAVEAVRVVDENVDQDQAVILIPLNFFFFWIFS